MQVDIQYNGHKGKITYNPASKKLNVKVPDVRKRKQIVSYLSKPHAFRIPLSSKNNDYRVDLCKPIESQMYLELALNQLYGDLKIAVLWETLKRG